MSSLERYLKRAAPEEGKEASKRIKSQPAASEAEEIAEIEARIVKYGAITEEARELCEALAKDPSLAPAVGTTLGSLKTRFSMLP